MRDFNETDKKKKKARIQIQENPANLSKEELLRLEDKVKASLKDGYISCPVAWRIAKEENVPKIAVGEITDRLSIRIDNCQIGFFKVEKTPYDDSDHKSIGSEIITVLETLVGNNELTCAKIFELARQFKLKPMVVANEANARDLKIHSCQLGCF
ncbi:MAG: hypothetical protein HN929_09525 [Chloroflexi bacterium]|jgi:hypothetical protein|nr:hypothetical protein [Chloroflexota bacterium]MBT7081688.1 hypothetical protein [Chloroflexota bacterium]MBT7290073.1 hypothetical protein [Chloroflexota bacterium]